MLYVFHVDTGTMVTFDMSLALESAARLQEAIERSCGVPRGKQVLLASGGESLDPDARVCSYAAGTDTNPIFLFSKAAIESTAPPQSGAQNDDSAAEDEQLAAQVDAQLALPATYQTVVARAALAQSLCETARQTTRDCERLVHSQHLQQQGWCSVVANLDDISAMFRGHAAAFEAGFEAFLRQRAESMALAAAFDADLALLAAVPVLPALLSEPAVTAGPDDSTTTSVSEADEAESGVTLLQWISAADDQSSLEQIADACQQELEKFDEAMLEDLRAEVQAALTAADKTDYKEIKGLEERLYGLEQLMVETKHLVQGQVELAQSLAQNQARAADLGDASVLPDLCASHRRQLAVMLRNHTRLTDIRRRCARAKEELCVNLYHRLRWVMYVENSMFDLERRLNLYHDGLKRLRRRLEVLRQIHAAPPLYLQAVRETVRRRDFSKAFLSWCDALSARLARVREAECSRRREFEATFAGHFLGALFPGLDDDWPAFGTRAPPPFDARLPALGHAHLVRLATALPELSATLPDISQQGDSLQETLVGGEFGSSAATFGSETDTEELDRLANSAMDLEVKRPTAEAARGERCRESVCAVMEQLSSLRAQLGALRVETCARSDEHAMRSRELAHALEQQMAAQQSELLGAQAHAQALEAQLQAAQQCCAQLQERLETAEQDTRRRLKEAADRTSAAHKAELDSLRSRFRLMSADRSPLEPPDKGDVIELANHEAVLAQAREDAAEERSNALAEARAVWQRHMEAELKAARTRNEQEKQVWFNEAMRRALAEKERQLSEAWLGEEPPPGPWAQRLRQLEQDNASLRAGAAPSQDLVASVSLLEQETGLSRDAATSPDRDSDAARALRGVSLASCGRGDWVLAAWSPAHSQYVVVQHASAPLHFLHADSLQALGLAPPPTPGAPPRKAHAPGAVVDKEYCHARKSENRYGVPKGTKFYRVRLEPLPPGALLSRSQRHSVPAAAEESRQPTTL